MSAKLTKLEQFPCPFLLWGPCTERLEGGCPPGLSVTECCMRPIYRKAMADHRCARLLRVFEKRWLERLRKAFLEVSDPSFRNWINLSSFVDHMQRALRAAGLLE